MRQRQHSNHLVGVTFFLGIVPCLAGPPELIPRRVLFGNPDRVNPQVSPDGKQLAYIAPMDNVLNLWVRTIGKDNDRAITHDRSGGISTYFWAASGARLLYLQDKEGDENRHLFAVDPDLGKVLDLTPFRDIQARVVAVERDFPDEVLVSLNDRDKRFRDVYRINVRTGHRNREILNIQGFVGFLADRSMLVRAGVTVRRNGGIALHVRDDWASPWRLLTTWEAEDSLNSGPVRFTADGRHLLIISSKGANTGELRSIALADGSETTIARDDDADVSDLIIHPITREVQAVAFLKERSQWQVLDLSLAACFDAIRSIRRGDFGLINRDRDDQLWVIYFNTDDGPFYYYLFDRETRQATLLFPSRSALEGRPLARMEPITVTARDGLSLRGYLTTPPGLPPRKLPMVLLVHRGPWYRDEWGYNGEVQWLANRGYVVLQINFRGSSGRGKAFLNAGNREWGGKMQTDLIDAAQWAVAQGVADPDRIGIYGGSYGGYATLTALTDTPEFFRCGVDVAGPSDLITFMETIPPYWKPVEPILWDRVGHPKKDAEFLRERSPMHKIERIVRPLLIAQGARDPRTRASDTREMVERLRKAGRDVQYLEYADEGHGLSKPENRLDFYAHAEAFLAEHLGGRIEPLEPTGPVTQPH